MVNSNSDTLEYIESFLEKINNSFNGVKVTPEQKRFLDAINEGYDALRDDQEKLRSLFAKEFQKLQNVGAYPKGINRLHTAIAVLVGFSLTALGGMGLTYWLGGSNLAAWSTSILLIDFVIGAGLGAGVSTPLKQGMKNHYKEVGAKGLVENWIASIIKNRQRSIAKLDAEIDVYMDDLIKGNYRIKEVKQKQGTRYNPFTKKSSTYTKNVKEFKKNFKVLPRGTRRKLNKVINTLNNDYIDISSTSCGFIGKSILTTISQYEEKAKDLKTNYISKMNDCIEMTEKILSLPKPTQKQIKEAYDELVKVSKEFSASVKELTGISSTISDLVNLAKDVQSNIGTDDTEAIINKAIERGNSFITKAESDRKATILTVEIKTKSIELDIQKKIQKLKEANKQKKITKTVVEKEQHENTEVKVIEKEIQKVKEEVTKKKVVKI